MPSLQFILAVILHGGLLGILFAIGFVRIDKLKNKFEGFKDSAFKFIRHDVDSLERERYSKVSREELMNHAYSLSQRILVIETKMEEREKSKDQS